jgi:hypothetical protein
MCAQGADLKLLQTVCQLLQNTICIPAVGGSYGVGITLKQHEETCATIIDAIAPGMAAAVGDKLQVADTILEIDATPVQDLPLPQVQALLAGTLGSNVKVKVSSAGKVLTDTLTRGSCSISTVDGIVIPTHTHTDRHTDTHTQTHTHRHTHTGVYRSRVPCARGP